MSKIEKLKKLIEINKNEKGFIFSISEKLDEIKNEIEQYADKNNIEHQELYEIIRGVKTVNGEKGNTPKVGVDFKQPKDGKDYILTKKDKKDIAKSIKVPVVEKVIEKTEVIKELPNITNITEQVDKDGIIKEVLSQMPDNKYFESEVEKLREDLKESKRLKGGGTSAIGVRQAFKQIAHTEQPSGTIDGTNKTFTVSKDIFWIAGFTINNQQIAELPNFTYTGKTITFDQAIPISYSGKDFEIKYIG